MTFHRSSRNIALVLALALTCSAALPATAATLPRLEADALGGNHVVLPADAGGKPLVLLLAYTPESEGDLKLWSRKLLNDRVATQAAVYVVVVADRAAFVSRRHVRQMVEGAAVGSKQQMNDNVLITFNGAGWLTLVPPGDKSTAGVVVCDASGAIVYAKRARFTPANLADVERAAKKGVDLCRGALCRHRVLRKKAAPAGRREGDRPRDIRRRTNRSRRSLRRSRTAGRRSQ